MPRSWGRKTILSRTIRSPAGEIQGRKWLHFRFFACAFTTCWAVGRFVGDRLTSQTGGTTGHATQIARGDFMHLAQTMTTERLSAAQIDAVFAADDLLI
jgi:hypothetical protein